MSMPCSSMGRSKDAMSVFSSGDVNSPRSIKGTSSLPAWQINSHVVAYSSSKRLNFLLLSVASVAKTPTFLSKDVEAAVLMPGSTPIIGIENSSRRF